MAKRPQKPAKRAKSPENPPAVTAPFATKPVDEYDQVGQQFHISAPDTAPDNAKLPVPATGEKSTYQSPLSSASLSFPFGIGAGLYMQAGGQPWLTGLNSFGSLWSTAFPGTPLSFAGGWFGWSDPNNPQPRRGGYVPYRLMSLDPTLRLVYSLITSPIMASQWTIVKKEGLALTDKSAPERKDGRIVSVPRAWIETISDMILPVRRPILSECLRYLQFGWRPFERVYEEKNGVKRWLTKLKPLLPDVSTILDGGKGNFGGVVTRGARLDPRKGFICSYDVEAGNLYGMSRHEAAFDPWIDGQYARVRAAMLQAKISGNLVVVKYRPGNTPIGIDTNGVPSGKKDNGAIANSIIATLFAGQGVAVPTTEYLDSDLQEHPELAKAAAWDVDVVQTGTYAPAIDGTIHERDFQDARKVRAWGWPERAMLEAQQGGIGQSDTKTHTDSASTDLELIDDDIASQISHGQPFYDVPGVIDEIVALNWGEEYRGLIAVKPAPLVDAKVQVYTQLLTAMVANPTLAPTFASVIDWPSLLSHLDIATTEDLKEKLPALLQQATDQQKQQADAKAQQTKNLVEKAQNGGRGRIFTGSPNDPDSNNGTPPIKANGTGKNGKLAAQN